MTKADKQKILPDMMREYESGKYTLKQVGEMFNVCAATAYYMLRDAGCAFIHKRRKPFTEKEREQRSKVHKGKKLSEEQRRIISERNSCDYNGLNGYGHTKQHNGGYVLAYVPHHPHAHKDGYVMLHTVLMERAIGRYLESNEVVHHINHDRSDNRLENLMLMDKHEHQSMHMKERYAKRRNAPSIEFV